MGLTAGVVGCSGVGEGVGGGCVGVGEGLWGGCSCLQSRCRRFLVVWEEGGCDHDYVHIRVVLPSQGLLLRGSWLPLPSKVGSIGLLLHLLLLAVILL